MHKGQKSVLFDRDFSMLGQSSTDECFLEVTLYKMSDYNCTDSFCQAF